LAFFLISVPEDRRSLLDDGVELAGVVCCGDEISAGGVVPIGVRGRELDIGALGSYVYKVCDEVRSTLEALR
jgi:hypothetical protein